MPTYEEDIIAAAGALRAAAGTEDDEEVQRFVVMFRALMASRGTAPTPPTSGAESDFPLFLFPFDPRSQADREQLQQARARIDELLGLPSG